MRKTALPLLFLALTSLASAQTTTFTENTPQLCQLATANCNGLPLDQGGTWQMLLGNNFFSIYNTSFTVRGSLQVTSNTVVRSPALRGAVGPEGQIEFDWTAADPITQQQYTGYATVQAHYVTECGRYCWPTLRVDSTKIFVNP